jgi:hypothetical protein
MPVEPRPSSQPDEGAPFLSWTGLYVVVAVALAAEIAAFAALTWIYR